jgi:hypothetical protein
MATCPIIPPSRRTGTAASARVICCGGYSIWSCSAASARVWSGLALRVIRGLHHFGRFSAAGSTGRRNTCVTLTKRSPNRFQNPRLPAMPKLRFLGRSEPSTTFFAHQHTLSISSVQDRCCVDRLRPPPTTDKGRVWPRIVCARMTISRHDDACRTTRVWRAAVGGGLTAHTEAPKPMLASGLPRRTDPLVRVTRKIIKSTFAILKAKPSVNAGT